MTWHRTSRTPAVTSYVARCGGKEAHGVTVRGAEFEISLTPAAAERLAASLTTCAQNARRAAKLEKEHKQP
jgi:hypothetical protein